MIEILFINAAHAQEHHEATTEAHGGGGHGDAHAIPWTSLGVQAFNFFFLFALLFWILRKSVKSHFEHRAAEYRQLVDRADAAKREAERGHQEIKERLAKLESTADQGLVEARAEAEELKKRLIQDARSFSEKLAQEAKRTAAAEVEKAKAELRHELMEEAVVASRESLKSSLGSSDQKKLQNEFVEKIQVVGG